MRAERQQDARHPRRRGEHAVNPTHRHTRNRACRADEPGQGQTRLPRAGAPSGASAGDAQTGATPSLAARAGPSVATVRAQHAASDRHAGRRAAPPIHRL